MIAQQFYKKEMIFMPAYKDEKKLVNGSPSSITRTGRGIKNRSGKEASPPKRKL